MKLEDLQPNAAVRGILPESSVAVVSVQWYGSEALELTYKTPTGKVANELLYRHDEPRLDIVEQGRPWSFDGDGGLFRLVSEAQRIRLAHLFDPVLAVHSSVVDPLPHQITAVYESMLPRQPLRFLLADDPGAGKTIMAGLLIKELIERTVGTTLTGSRRGLMKAMLAGGAAAGLGLGAAGMGGMRAPGAFAAGSGAVAPRTLRLQGVSDAPWVASHGLDAAAY